MAHEQLAKDCDTEAGKSSKKMGKEEEKDQAGSSRIKQCVRNLQKNSDCECANDQKNVVSFTMDHMNRLTSPKLQNWNLFNIVTFWTNDPQLCNGPGRKLLAIKDASSDALRKALEFVALKYWSGHWQVTGLSPDLWVSCHFDHGPAISLSLSPYSLQVGLTLGSISRQEKGICDIQIVSISIFLFFLQLSSWVLQPH